MRLFNNIDLFFFQHILTYSNKIEKNIQKSLDYKLNIDKETFNDLVNKKFIKINITDIKKNKNLSVNCFLVGFYIKNEEIYNFIQIHEVLYKSISKLFNNNTIDKLFKNNEIKIEHKYKNVIPYIIGLSYKYNLVRIQTADDIEMYILLDLGIPIPIKNIEKEIQIINDFYKFVSKKQIKKSSKKETKRSSKNKNKNKNK